jgi:hypothetical protein
MSKQYLFETKWKKFLNEQETTQNTTPSEESPFQSAMTKFAGNMQKMYDDNNLISKVGSENYDALSKIATDNGMTLSNETDGTYWKWTKDLGGDNQLVFIILNSGNDPRTGGVTSYVDRDGGECLEAKLGELVETGNCDMGTYPMHIEQLGLVFNGKNIAEQPDLLTSLQNKLTKQQNTFN